MKWRRHSTVHEVAGRWVVQEYDHRRGFQEKVDVLYPDFRQWKETPEYHSESSKTLIQNVFSVHKRWAFLEDVHWELFELTIEELSLLPIHPALPDWQQRAGGDYTVGSLARSAVQSEEQWAEEIRSLAYSKAAFDTTFVAKQIGLNPTVPSSWALVDGMHRGPALILRGSSAPVSLFGGASRSWSWKKWNEDMGNWSSRSIDRSLNPPLHEPAHYGCCFARRPRRPSEGLAHEGQESGSLHVPEPKTRDTPATITNRSDFQDFVGA